MRYVMPKVPINMKEKTTFEGFSNSIKCYLLDNISEIPEFLYNYTKVGNVVNKGSGTKGKQKIQLIMLPSVGIEPRTSCGLL